MTDPGPRAGRPRGARDAGHEARRREMLGRLMARLSAADAMHASYRELAAAAGASMSTMQHYFGKRTDIVEAVLAEARAGAAPFLATLRVPEEDFAESIRAAVGFVRLGFEQFGLSALFAMGLAEGLRHSVLGPRFVADVLEVSIEALTARLEAHQARGQMRRDVAARDAAIRLLSPLIFMYLHQKELAGEAGWPADMDRFAAEHVGMFVLAHRA